MRKTLFFAAVLLLAVLMILPAAASGYAKIDDRAGFFGGTDWNTDTLTGGNESRFSYYLLTDLAEDYPSESEVLSRCGIGRKDDAVVLAVYRTRAGVYHYDIYTFGKADDAFSQSDIDEVLDAPGVYNNLKAGRIEEGVKAFIGTCAEIEARHLAEEAKWEAARVPRGIAVTLVVFVVSGGIAMLSVALYYRKKLHGEVYPLDRYAKLNLTKQVDRFVGSYITRVRVNTNNGGSSGRSSGGGGGGHRGGR